MWYIVFSRPQFPTSPTLSLHCVTGAPLNEGNFISTTTALENNSKATGAILGCPGMFMMGCPVATTEFSLT